MTSYFPPDNHVGSWRWERLTRFMPADRFNVFVVTSDNNADYSSSDFGINALKEVRRVSSLYDLSFRKLYQFLIRKKAIINVPLSAEKSTDGQRGRFLRFRRWISLILDFPDFSWRGKKRFMIACDEIISSQQIDIIIASHPFVLPIRCASLLSNKWNIPWIADMRDGWTGNLFSPYLDYPYLRYLLGLVEKKVLSTASKVVVINEQLAKTIKCREAQKVIISNSYEEEKLTVEPNIRKEGNPIKLVFTGGIKNKHLFRPFLDALKIHNDKDPNSIFLNYFGRDFTELSNYAQHIELDKKVMINHGYVSNTIAKDFSKRADLLVIFGWNGPFGNTYQTGKIFDYMESGVPILCIDNTESCLGSQIANCRLGLTTVEPQEIVDFFRKIRTSKFFLSELRSNFDKNAIKAYSVNSTGKRYCEVIEELVSRSGLN